MAVTLHAVSVSVLLLWQRRYTLSRCQCYYYGSDVTLCLGVSVIIMAVTLHAVSVSVLLLWQRRYTMSRCQCYYYASDATSTLSPCQCYYYGSDFTRCLGVSVIIMAVTLHDVSVSVLLLWQ